MGKISPPLIACVLASHVHIVQYSVLIFSVPQVTFGEGVVGSVACGKPSITLNDVRILGSPWSESIDEVPETDTESLLCVPVADKGRERFAVMVCINKLEADGFGKNDLATFEAFVSEIAFILKQQEQRHMYSMIFHNQNRSQDREKLADSKFYTSVYLYFCVND